MQKNIYKMLYMSDKVGLCEVGSCVVLVRKV